MSKLPKWFDGKLYDEGDKVRNPYSGEEYILTSEELSMYDFILGSQMIVEMGVGDNNKIIEDLRKGLDWFRKNNNEAYMVLLD